MITTQTNKQTNKHTSKQTNKQNSKQQKLTMQQLNLYMYGSNSRQ